MYTGYQMYQAERPKSAREQREIDMGNAKLAAAVASPVRPLAGQARRVPGTRPGGRRRDARPPAPRPAGSGPGPAGGRARERRARYGGGRGPERGPGAESMRVALY